MSCVFSWTGDLGVESRLPTFRGNLLTLFGPWVRDVDGDNVGAEVGHGPPEEAAGFDFQAQLPALDIHHEDRPDPYAVDLQGSIYVCGVLHVVHNCTESLKDSLEWWPEFVVWLTQVTRLLSRNWSKSRLVATCFSEWPHQVWQGLYTSFDASVYEGRWGSALYAVSQLLPLRPSLVAAWSLRKFTFGQAAPADEEDTSGANLKLCVADEAIRSQRFWAYMEMVDCLAETLTEVAAWAETCPCHSVDPSLSGPTRHQRVRLFQQRVGLATCPMRTRRAPELADFEAVKLLRRLMSVALPSLLLMPAISATSEDDKRLVLSDFVHGRQHLLFVFNAKFGHWRQLPWVCDGIAHYDRSIAAQCGRRALSLYQHSPPEVQRHPIVEALCGLESPGRQELERFVNRQAELAELPTLQVMAGKFLFTTVAERWVESLHATAKQLLKSAPHHSAQHLAWHLAKPHIERIVCDGRPGGLQEFAAVAQRVRSPRLALVHSGPMLHPDVCAFVTGNTGNMRELSRLKRKWVVELLFHVDANTLFQDPLQKQIKTNVCGHTHTHTLLLT
jgi:hypothetical protein